MAHNGLQNEVQKQAQITGIKSQQKQAQNTAHNG